MATAPDPLLRQKKSETRYQTSLPGRGNAPDGRYHVLQKIMSQRPIPVVICSSLVSNGCETMLKALEYGAVEITRETTYGDRAVFEGEPRTYL